MKYLNVGTKALSPLWVAMIAACGGPQPVAPAPVAQEPKQVAQTPVAPPENSPTQAAETQDAMRLGGLERPWSPSLNDFEWQTSTSGSGETASPPETPPDTAEDTESAGSVPVEAPSPAKSPWAFGAAGTLGMGAGGQGGFGTLGQSGLIAFSSNRDTGGGYGADVFVYDHLAGTVLALPGVNTSYDEINPRISGNGRWLIYASDAEGDFNIYLYDVQTSLIDTLASLNTPYDEVAPTIDDAGSVIAYAFRRNGRWTLGVHEVATQRTYIPAPVNNLYGDVRTPWISGDGRYVAFAADVDRSGYDIFLYGFESGVLVSPPFVNSEDDEFEPALSQDGSQLVFVSDRAGNDDIFVSDLRSGFTDRLVLANSNYRERSPRFLGGSPDTIVFNSDRSGRRRLYVFNTGMGVLDTLAIAHDIGSDDEMLDQSSSTAGISGSLFGGRLGGLRGGGGGLRGVGRFW